METSTTLDFEFDWSWESTGASSNFAARDRLSQEINKLKIAYHETYKENEPVDEKHRNNFYSSLEGTRVHALASLPLPSSTSLDSWIEEHLGRYSYIYLSNCYIFNNDIEDQNGTLFQEEVSEDVKVQVEDPLDEYAPRLEQIGTYQETVHERIIRGVSIRIQRSRGLNRTSLDEYISEALVKYAELLAKKPGQAEGFYVKGIINAMTDQWRYDNRHKRKQVELVLTNEESDYPQRAILLDQDLTIEEWELTLKKTQAKTWNAAVEWADTAPDDEPMPKALKQRLARLPKIEFAEREVTHSWGLAKSSRAPLNLGEDNVYEFPVTTRKENK